MRPPDLLRPDLPEMCLAHSAHPMFARPLGRGVSDTFGGPRKSPAGWLIFAHDRLTACLAKACFEAANGFYIGGSRIEVARPESNLAVIVSQSTTLLAGA